MKVLTTEEIMLLSARSDVRDCVDFCFDLLERHASNNNYEIEWYIEEFLSQFNKEVSKRFN